jgi:glycosyl transferase family 25
MLVLINLDSATERRARMMRQLQAQGLPFTRVGIDFRRLARSEVAHQVRERFPGLHIDMRKLSGAEIGCWASHLTAWQSLADGNAATMAVIEDDLVLAPHFGAVVDTLLATQPAALPLDLIYLGTSSRNLSQRRQLAVGELAIHMPVGVIFNTWGYVVRREWVRAFFEHGGKVDLPIDHFIGGRARWCAPRIGVLQPRLVTEDAELGRASQIAPHTPRLDRATVVEAARRAVLASPLSDLYYRTVYKHL